MAGLRRPGTVVTGAQIRLDHRRVALHFARGALGQEPPVRQRQHPVEHRRHQPHVMFDHQDGQAHFALHVFDPEGHVASFLDRQAGGRFIQQQKLGSDGQRAADFDDLAHAIGQTRDQAVAVRFQFEEGNHLLHHVAVALFLGAHPAGEGHVHQLSRITVHVAAHQQVAEHRRMIEQFDVLKGPRNPQFGDAMRGKMGDLFAFEEHLPACGLVEARDHVEHGGFACAVRADQGEHLARFYREAQTIDGFDPTKCDGQVPDFQQAHFIRSVFR